MYRIYACLRMHAFVRSSNIFFFIFPCNIRFVAFLCLLLFFELFRAFSCSSFQVNWIVCSESILEFQYKEFKIGFAIKCALIFVNAETPVCVLPNLSLNWWWDFCYLSLQLLLCLFLFASTVRMRWQTSSYNHKFIKCIMTGNNRKQIERKRKVKMRIKTSIPKNLMQTLPSVYDARKRNETYCLRCYFCCTVHNCTRTRIINFRFR